MGYADRDDDLHDYDPGIEGTRIFPAMRQAPGPGADRYAGYEWYEASSPGHYERPIGYAAGPLASQAGVIRPGNDPAEREWVQRERPSRERPSRERPSRERPSRERPSRERPSRERPSRERPSRERLSRERLSRMRPDRWIIAVGSITGAVAVYVALTTAGVPARPMPSPFAPATTQGAPAHPGSTTPVTCVTSGP